jgi:FdhE protein
VRIDENIAFLEKTSRDSPEYQEIMAFFLNILVAIRGREGETGISFRVPAGYGKEKIAGGFPLLAPEDMAVNSDEAASFLDLLADVLVKGGKDGDDHLSALKSALSSGGLDLTALYAACLKRDRKVLDEGAAANNLPPPLLEFVLETALRCAIGLVAEKVPPDAVTGWQESYCPICGARAGMAELTGEEGKRLLSCSACSFTWGFKRLACPYCGNDDPETLTYFQAGDGPTRVNICRKCSRYIKTRDSRLGNAGVPLDAEDLATIHLDLLAAREGFERGK